MKNKKDVELKFELPGFEKKDIKVNIYPNSASITAQKEHEKKIKKENFLHHERSHRSFSYLTTLPPVNHGKAKTEFKNGILKIKIPKK